MGRCDACFTYLAFGGEVEDASGGANRDVRNLGDGENRE